MSTRYLLTSLTRIADFHEKPFDIEPLPREQWSEGDYIAARVTGEPTPYYRIENTRGRRVGLMAGDHAISALGTRAATLEGVGSWRDVGPDNILQALTGAGLLAKATSKSRTLAPFTQFDYVGHVVRDGKHLNMKDFVQPVQAAQLQIPVVLLVGTSMSAGKTMSGRLVIHELKRYGLKVAGAKFTGAARYNDVLSFADAGADHILDFVDAGMPSTVVPKAEFRTAMEYMVSRIAALDVDVLVAEAGASPLEPYNGAVAVQMLRKHVCFTILCASDPYAVVGVMKAFRLKPDLVAGPAAATESAVELVRALTGLPALDNLNPNAGKPMQEYIRAAIPELFADL